MPAKKAPEEKPKAVFGRVKNSLKIGIVGLPNVGKSSLFNLLTEQAVAAENYPFCTIEPTEARVPFPDARYDHLVDMWKPASKYPAYLFVTDIAGLVKGASKGEGLGNAFLSNIQAVDGIYHCVRTFENEEIVHVESTVDPVRDLEIIQNELCLKDLATLETAVAKETKECRASPTMKLSKLFIETMAKVKEMLEANIPIRNGNWSTPEVEMINEKLQVITTKPVIYLINLDQKDFLRKKNKHLAKIAQWVQEHGGGQMIPFSIEFEQNLWERRDDPAAVEAFLAETNGKSSLPKMITNGYHELNLIHYFTAGEKEVRCWTVFKGALAPQAAGVIHSDFERGFIKAEVVSYADFKAIATSAGMSELKAAGKYRQEGKAYVVQDGDIIHFQFNVTAPPKKK